MPERAAVEIKQGDLCNLSAAQRGRRLTVHIKSIHIYLQTHQVVF